MSSGKDLCDKTERITAMKTICYNGKVYTGELPLVSAFVVENGVFTMAGSDKDAKALASSNDCLIDLKGKFVCAGFNDSHMHLLSYGKSLNSVQLAKHTDSIENLVQAMKAFLAEHEIPEGQWLVGRGWNQDYFTDEKRMPNRHDLDRVSTEIPMYASRCCGHCMTVNTKALELLGITENTVSPDGGRIGIEDGKPDGLFYDNAMQLVYDHLPAPDKEMLKHEIKTACKALNSFGVTSSQTDDYCVYRNVSWRDVNAAYQELEAEGELTVRVYEQSNFETVESLKEFVESGCRTGVGTEFFKIGPLKMLGDGSLGARTAYLSQPYADDPSTKGIPVFTKQLFEDMICYANANDMQVAIHTIGDACLDDVLAACQKALTEHPREDHRHGIVHCQITRPDQLKQIAELNMHVYAQSIFLDYDIHIVEDRVGTERAATSYAWKRLMRDGVSVSNGTDCPVELPDALAGMQCAVTRMTLHDNLGPYLPEEAFTIQEALDSYTVRGAESSFEEKIKGKIQPGYLADFVVLGENPFEVDAQKLKDIEVCETYLGGHKVYEKSE